MNCHPIEDVLRYHRIGFDAPNKVGNKKIQVFKKNTFCMSLDQTAGDSLFVLFVFFHFYF